MSRGFCWGLIFFFFLKRWKSLWNDLWWEQNKSKNKLNICKYIHKLSKSELRLTNIATQLVISRTHTHRPREGPKEFKPNIMHTRTHVWEGAVDLQSHCVALHAYWPNLESQQNCNPPWRRRRRRVENIKCQCLSRGPEIEIELEWVTLAGQADDLSDRAANCSAINYRFNTLPWKKRWPALHCHDLRLIRSHLCSAWITPVSCLFGPDIRWPCTAAAAAGWGCMPRCRSLCKRARGRLNDFATGWAELGRGRRRRHRCQLGRPWDVAK